VDAATDAIMARSTVGRSNTFAAVLLLCGGCAFAGQAEPVARQFSLVAQSAQFWKLIPKDSRLVLLAKDFGFTEGPVWDPAGFLYVSDEVQNRIYRVSLDGARTEIVALGDPDGSTYDQQHHLIDCASVLRAIIRVSPDGQVAVLADRYQGRKFNSPNDIVMGPDGALYFTDPTLDLPPGESQELAFQGVFRLDRAGKVRLLSSELSQPNGLAFSPDGRKLYVDDSQQRNIRVYDFQRDGTLAHGRIFGEEPGGKLDGVPDGMKVDRKGNLYVTGPGGIWVWDAQGRHLGTILMPEQPANLAWGGADLGTLYITASTSLYQLATGVNGFVPYLRSPPVDGGLHLHFSERSLVQPAGGLDVH
jgi:gluconolactonase